MFTTCSDALCTLQPDATTSTCQQGQHAYCHFLLFLQVSDAVAHAVDAPAEPKKDAGWRAFHDQLAKEMQATKV